LIDEEEKEKKDALIDEEEKEKKEDEDHRPSNRPSAISRI